MARRREIQKRRTLPDPKYKNHTISRFVNAVMKSGKKSLAERIVYGALEIVTERMPGEDIVRVFETAIEKCEANVAGEGRGVLVVQPIRFPSKSRRTFRQR